jgi:hypothetical protein
MKKFKTNQKGNVLFLILIAVALFAALSYAVTQSSRSGGDASRETNILNAAQLTQYPTSIRTAVLRLVIDGYQDTNILFNSPDDITTSQAYEVFSSIGGGAVYQNAPSEIMQTGGINPTGIWFFNMDFEIPNLGRTNIPSLPGNELIAFLPGVTESVCSRINQEANIISDATIANPVVAANTAGTADVGARKNVRVIADYDGTHSILDTAITSPYGLLKGRAFGCYHDNNAATNAPYVVYTVILER